MISIPRSERGNQAQWALTAPLLVAHLAGVGWALPAALGLCAATTGGYLARLRSWRSYRVQVRVGFKGVVCLGMLPGFACLLWIPALGTSAQVLVGYCPMARVLDLMPWNRDAPLSLELVGRTIARAPGDEGLLRYRPRAGRSPACPG